MVVELNYFKYLLLSIVAFVITYALGHLFVSFFYKKNSEEPYLSHFIKLIAGLLIETILYSMYTTTFFTINSIFLFFILSYYIYIKYAEKWKYNNTAFLINVKDVNLKEIALILLLFLFIFTIQYLKLKDPINNIYFEVHSDYYCYALNIDNINSTGVEGVKNNVQYLNETIRSIYHFGEIWNAAFFCRILGIHSVLSLLLITFSIAILTYFLGIASLLNCVFKQKGKHILVFSFIFLVASSLSFYIPKNSIITRGDWYDFSVIFQTKVIYSVSILLLTVIFLIKNKYTLLFISFLTLPLLATTITPTIYIAANVFLFYLVFNKQVSVKKYIQYQIFILVNFLLILFYMYLISVKNTQSTAITPIKLDVIQFGVSYFKTAFNCFAGQIIKITLSNLFIILIWAYLYYKKNVNNKINTIIIYLIVVNISGILSYSMFHFIVDSIQFWVVVYIPSVAIITTLIFYNLYSTNKKTFLLIGLFVIAYFYHNIYFGPFRPLNRSNKIINTNFAEAVYNQYELNKNKKIICLSGANDFKSIFHKNIDMILPVPYLRIYFPQYNPVSLSSFDVPIDTSTLMLEKAEREIVYHTVFYKYVQKLKNNNSFVSISESQLRFIKEYNVGYIMATMNATISPEIRSLISDEITDEKGNTFYTLRD